MTTANAPWIKSFTNSIKPKKVRGFLEFAQQEIVIPDGKYKGLHFNPDIMPWNAAVLREFSLNRFNRFFAEASRQTWKTVGFFQIPIMWHLFENEEDVIVGVPDIELAHGIWGRESCL